MQKFSYKWLIFNLSIGKKHLRFDSMDDFKNWKEQKEEDTYTMYVRKQQTYKPKASESKHFLYKIVILVIANLCSNTSNILLLLLSWWRLPY